MVVVLKLLLAQCNLDRLFTGGLSNYRLYVMVAYQLELKDNDNNKESPACVLLGFLARFGVEEPPTRDNVLRTKGNGEADLSWVYRLDDCVECFAECHRRLTEERRNNNDNKSSICCVLNHERLQWEHGRRRCAGPKRSSRQSS